MYTRRASKEAGFFYAHPVFAYFSLDKNSGLSGRECFALGPPA